MDDGFTMRLQPGQALTLRATRGPRRLVVTHGRLWLTLSGGGADHWLSAGEGLTLAGGCEAVVEGGPTAAFQLLQPAPRALRASRRWPATWAIEGIRAGAGAA